MRLSKKMDGQKLGSLGLPEVKIICSCCGREVTGFRVMQKERFLGHDMWTRASRDLLTFRQAEKIKRVREKHIQATAKCEGVIK